MQKYVEVILGVTISFIISMILNVAHGHFFGGIGSIQVSKPVVYESIFFVPIDVVNYDSKHIDDVIVSIPNSTDLAAVLSSKPVQLSQPPALVTSSSYRNIQISGIAPRSATKILIPVDNHAEAELIAAVNADERRLVVLQDHDLQSPLARQLGEAIRFSVVSAIVYGVILLFLYNLTEQRIASAEQRMAAIEAKETDQIAYRERLERQLRELSDSTDKINNRLLKQRLLLLARISDYARELQFWRDTIRKILYEIDIGQTKADHIIFQVTKTLKTYGTLRQVDEYEFETIKVLAHMLSDSQSTERRGEDDHGSP